MFASVNYMTRKSRDHPIIKREIIFFLICLGAGSRQYCRYTKSSLVITPLKEIWESPRANENLTSGGFQPTTSG